MKLLNKTYQVYINFIIPDKFIDVYNYIYDNFKQFCFEKYDVEKGNWNKIDLKKNQEYIYF